MNIFRDVSIKHKLTALAILPSTLVLLSAVLVFFIFDELSLRKAMVQEAQILSEVIGANNSAALLFNDPASASENLAALNASPHIINGNIYTAGGEIFASYTRKNPSPVTTFAPALDEGHRFDSNSLSVVHRIMINGNAVGTVHLTYDLETLHTRRNGYLALTITILALVAGLVLFLLRWLNKAITEPILSLAKTARAITLEKDYSTRASGVAHGEFGILINGFNEMLVQIQERDARLAQYNEGLEQLVSVRTAALKTSNDNLRIQIEENTKIEEELFRTRQLESLGLLAGGIAHDFNNLLAAILMNTSLARKYSPSDSKAATRLEVVESACLRAKDLTQQLLTFSKGGAPITRVTSIADIIGDSARFVFRGSKSRCSFEIDDDIWPVEVDEGQISQVIHNLAINADQAMPDGGTVHIRAENLQLCPGSHTTLAPGRYVRISVRDTGSGIPKEQLSKIFTPYFTTKKTGSGLGLATSYSIISKHNGLITAESEVGVGTTFNIFLPASEKELQQTHAVEIGIKQGSGKVLIMDDDQLVQAGTGEALIHAGYQIGYARCGAEAIEMYLAAQQSGAPYDLIIMDLTIPGGIGGEEAIKRLREIDPQVKAIVASGYSQESLMSDFRSYGFKGMLAKPFSINDLCHLVHSVIHDTH